MTEGQPFPPGFRSGFVALVGRPNVGKSTLLNRLVGQVVAIATHRAQTTRRRVRGILSRERSQVVFIDTPGLHLVPGKKQAREHPANQRRALNRYMLDEARAALAEVDLLVLLIEAQGRGSEPTAAKEDQLVLEVIGKTRCPRILVINKIDSLKSKEKLLPLIAEYDAMKLFAELIPVSAKTGDGLERLVEAIETRLPEGPPYFPRDMVTDEPERQLVAEFIREQILLQVEQEVPYESTVDVSAFEEMPQRQLVRIQADIFVERKSQRGILIGKGGQRLKAIGTGARKAIEAMLGCRVYLEIKVRVKPGWSHTATGLRSVGFERQ